MRLADVLSKPSTTEFIQIDGFMNKKLPVGAQQKIDIGQVGLNFHCEKCGDTRTFWSGNKLHCITVNERQISIDCVLECGCGSSVAVWFLIESYSDFVGPAPEVRILKRREKLSEHVRLAVGQYADFTEMLDKSERAYRDGLGAGSIVYLRKILEQITVQIAESTSITTKKPNGKLRPFKELLEEVDQQCSIIPKEFSSNGYRLFGDLSDVVHGEHDEELALRKYEPLHRLVVGVLENVKNNKEIMSAVGSLGWNDER